MSLSQSRFLRLPAEIRENVYSILLRSANNLRNPDLEDGWEYDPDDLKSGPHYRFDLSIFRVNKQIYSEAKKLFQDNVFVKITTPWYGAISHVNGEGKVAVVLADKEKEPLATEFQDFHLRAMISMPESSLWDQQFEGEQYSMITCLDDVEAFARIWYLSHLNTGRQLNPHLMLRLDLKNPYNAGTTVPKRLQEKLLLPFGKVKDLHGMAFDFHGSPFFADCPVYPSVKSMVLAEQAIPAPTPEECLDSCMAHKQRGDELISKKCYTDALQEYYTAFSHIHIYCSGRDRQVKCDGYYSGNLCSGPYKNRSGHYVRLLLRIQLVNAVVQAYIYLRNYEDAHFWGQRTIRIFRENTQNVDYIGGIEWEAWVRQTLAMGFAGEREMGWIFHRTGLALKKSLNMDTTASRGTGRSSQWNEVEALMQAARIYAEADQLLEAELMATKIRDVVQEKTLVKEEITPLEQDLD